MLRVTTATAELPRNLGWARGTQARAPKAALAGQRGLILPYIPSASPGEGHIQPPGKGWRLRHRRTCPSHPRHAPARHHTEEVAQEYAAVAAAIVT